MKRLAVAALATLICLTSNSTRPAVPIHAPLPPSPTILLVQAPAKLVFTDINTAPKPVLESLPGIRSEQAEAIIKGRPYAHPDELVRRAIIARSVYERIKERIIADGQRP